MTIKSKYYILLLCVCVATFYISFFSGQFLRFDYKVKEYILKLKNNRLSTSNDVWVVNIDKASLKKYGKGFPLSRKLIALLIRRLKLSKLVIVTFPLSGATGTAGDVALKKVLEKQHNVLLGVRFLHPGSSLEGIVPVEGLIWMPWRRLLPFAMIGGLNFYVNPVGELEGFYPFFSYEGRLISHVVMKMLAVQLGLDEKSFTFSKRANKLLWRDASDKVLLSLPLDYKGGISVAPGFNSIEKIRTISFSSVLPYDLYLKYKHHGIQIPAFKEASGKICVIGYSAPEYSEFFRIHGQTFPLNTVLAKAYLSLANKMVEYDVPLVYQFIVAILLGTILIIFSLYQPIWGLLLFIGEVIIVFLMMYIFLLNNIFILGVKFSLGLFVCFLSSVFVYWRLMHLHKVSDYIEKQVVREIKRKTTYLPPEIDWAEIKIKEVTGGNISGGMYDFVKVNSERLGIAIGDVMDKGRDAIMKIAYLRGLLRSHSIITHQPGEVVYSINKALVKGGTVNMTCKFLYVLLDASKSKLIFSGAGGVSFIVIDKYGKQVKCFEVEERILLGLSREIFYEPKDMKLEKGDTIILYSPSIFNIRNHEGRSYDVDRIGKLVLAYAKLPMHFLIEKIVSDIKGFSSDPIEDFFIIGIKWRRDSLFPEEENIFVGISQREKELLLFYKHLAKNKDNLPSQ